MLVPGIFKLGRVSIMLQIWHLDFIHFLLPVMVGVVEILVLMSICLYIYIYTLYIYMYIYMSMYLYITYIYMIYILIHLEKRKLFAKKVICEICKEKSNNGKTTCHQNY